MSPGQQVMCVKDLSGALRVLDGFLRGMPVIPQTYPKLHEELIIDEVSDTGVRFYCYDQFGGRSPTWWPHDAFVSTLFMEDSIKDLMKSTVEEEAFV